MNQIQTDKKAASRILISCCLFYGAIAGILVNCNGQFYQSIADGLQVSLGNVTISSAIMGVASLFATPFVVKTYRKCNAKIVTAIAILAYAGSHMLTGFISQLWQFYIIAIIRGIFQGFLLYYLVSSLIKAWYVEKSGTALSITAFSSGIVGIISNLLIGIGIDQLGWRMTLILSCLAAIIISLPGMCIYLYRSPEEKAGDKIYTETEKKESDVLEPQKKSVFLMGLVMAVFLVLPYCFTQHLKVYAISAGFSQILGASLISISMIGNISAKFLLSIFSDRIGVKKSAQAVIGMIILGFLLLIIPPQALCLYGGALLLGTSASFIPILIPQITAVVYKGKAFDAVYSKYSTVLSMASAMWISIIGVLYTCVKSYRPLFVAGMVLIIISLGLLEIFVRNERKK